MTLVAYKWIMRRVTQFGLRYESWRAVQVATGEDGESRDSMGSSGSAGNEGVEVAADRHGEDAAER